MERRLGRGLGSLLGGETAAAEVGEPRPEAGGAVEIPLTQVRPNPNQPRKAFDSDQLEELRDSILAHGILHPICVRRVDGGYEIISGERRWRAARLAGLRRIPATVREDVDEDTMLELALVENVQRQDLNPLEKADGYREMMTRLGLTQEQVAAKVGLRRSSVANHIRLLDLPREAQDAVAAGLISMGHGKALLSAKKPAQALELLKEAVRKDLSVRELELRARRGAMPAARGEARPAREIEPWAKEVEARIRERLGVRVRVQNGEGFRGQIVLQYGDRETLDRICEALAPRDEL
ncbi:MAG: ParB/RepB/Spo0J family partition protein [bacterium]|nr:ParB/RepB/Spo0J family partition protein [bacterium]